MLKPGHYILAIILVLISFGWIISRSRSFGTGTASRQSGKNKLIDSINLHAALQKKASLVKEFAHARNFNESFCFLVDMNIQSGKNRFFIYDIVKDSVRLAGLVAHGRCNQNWLEGRKFGNTVGCGCSSLGKYRVGAAYNGRFGEAFKLYGLDSSNNKAFERFVVLHSYECVPNAETDAEICQSDGCPMLSPAFLNKLKPMIRTSKKPILLWIYDGSN